MGIKAGSTGERTMKITFLCTGCGKRLKARPDSVGRTRKCPVCATRVTCTVSVAAARPAAESFDAEIVEAELVPASKPARVGPKPVPAAARRDPSPTRPESPPAFDPFADADDDPYQLAGPDPADEPANEPKKPCPMCGETILAAAVKCRFCGEVFDSKLKKGKAKKRRKSSGGASSSTGLRDVGIGIACMGVGIGLTVAGYAAASSNENGGRFMVFYGLILGGFVQTCRGIGGIMRGD